MIFNTSPHIFQASNKLIMKDENVLPVSLIL